MTSRTPIKSDDGSPANVYGLDSTVAYTLYAENFPGRCWGEKINAAINEAMAKGGGSATIKLPPGALNVTQPIRFWRQRKTADGVDTTGASAVASRDVRQVWRAIRGGTTADLPAGLTLEGTGRTISNAWVDCAEPNQEAKPDCHQAQQRGGTVLVWAGPPNNVMIDLPSPFHCRLRRLTLDGGWVPGTMGIRCKLATLPRELICASDRPN